MARAPEEYPENIESDRDIRPLSTSGSKLPAIFFLIAAVGGIILLLALQLFGSRSSTADLNRETFRPPSTNVRLPEPQAPPVTPPAPAPEPEEQDIGFDPLELERLRQIALLEEQKLKLERERLEAAEAERRRRRQSEMVLVDVSEDRRQASSMSGSTSGDGFGSEPFSVDGFPSQNEVFENANERFLRDAGNVEVVEAQALRLQNQETLVTQGTFISGVLETAINSDLPGMVRAIVDKNVYGRTGDFVIIPKGSRLIGRYRSGLAKGQGRIFVVWSRLERPDGVVVDLGSPGTDALGVAGLGGDVDTHFFSRFGAATLLSTIGPVVSLLLDDGDQTDQEREVINGAEQGFNRSAEIALEYSIDRPPTVRVAQGTKITVFVNRDLSFHDVGVPVQ